MSQTFGASRFESIVDRSITEIKSNVKTIGQYAFYGCTNLTTAEFPNATSIGQYAFSGCSKLESTEFPNLLTINSYGFYNCTSLETIDLPNVTKGYDRAFRGCTKLVNINAPKMSPEDNIFQDCTALKRLYLPSTTFADAGMCAGCTGLEYFIGPKVNIIYTGAFNNCSSLIGIDLGTTSSSPSGFARQNAFNACTSLSVIILRCSSIYQCSEIKAFNNSSLVSGGAGCIIYIPKTLYDHLGDGTSLDYKAAANWSTIDGYGTITWAQIEGSQYENYYVDGTPIT